MLKWDLREQLKIHVNFKKGEYVYGELLPNQLILLG